MQPVAREGEPSQQSELTLQQSGKMSMLYPIVKIESELFSDLADASCSDQQFLVFTQDANPELTYKEFLMIPPGKLLIQNRYVYNNLILSLCRERISCYLYPMHEDRW